ncbi:hypothetical protein [Pseudoalteromonas phenolica]|uniref:hypothetical protein n=1 Tax=Pseudoalteromonas phenolica TaxID=161398 RepID=UPI00384B43A8
MTTAISEQLDNVKRQAKRLSKAISIPLKQAQQVLSEVVYDCSNWQELKLRINAQSDDGLILLTNLHPKADVKFMKAFDNNKEDILSRMEEHPSFENGQNSKILLNIFSL